MTEPSEGTHGVPLHRNRDFVCLAGAQLLSLSGREIETIVMPLLVLGLTRSPAQVGLVAACQSLPYLLLSLPAGALVDRASRRRVMLICEAVRALAFATLPFAWLAGALTLAQIYAVALVAGSAFVFHNIAEISAVPLVVGKSNLARAMSANTMVEWVGENAGPALGGALTALGRTTVVGAMLAYAVQTVMLASSLIFLGAMKSPLLVTRPPGPRPHLLAEMREGLAWLFAHPQVRTLALLAMATATCFAPAGMAIIILARTSLHASPASIGLMFSATGVAGFVANLASPWLRARARIGVITVAGGTAWAIGLAFVAAAPSMLWLALAWAIMPIFSGLSGAAGISYRLSLIPEAMQGRVNSVFRFMAWGLQPASLALGGLMISWIGARATLGCLAAGLAVTAVGAALSPIRNAV